jgi:hypothetical protein
MARDARTVVAYGLGIVALAGLVVLAPFFFASGLLAPGWAVVTFVGIWLVLFVLGCLWIRRRPVRVIPLPILAVAVWFGGISAGEAWLGWTG